MKKLAIGVLVLTLAIAVVVGSAWGIPNPPPGNTAYLNDQLVNLKIGSTNVWISLLANPANPGPLAGTWKGPNNSFLDFSKVIRVKVICSNKWDLAINYGENLTYNTSYATAVPPTDAQFGDVLFARAKGATYGWRDINGVSADVPEYTGTFHRVESGNNNCGTGQKIWIDLRLDMADAASKGINFPSGAASFELDFLACEA